ncbi:MAG: transporter [Hyphomicrobiales bacterium]|nr:transporter [Hyphomicrobiales bacterium]
MAYRRRHRLRRPGPVRTAATRPHLPGLRGFLALSAVLIAISPETATLTPGAWRSLLPRTSVPHRVRHLLPVAAAVFLATWATGAFYQASFPALVENQLHTRSPLILGLVFAAYMAPGVVGAPIGGRFTSAVAQRAGMITFLAGMIGIITAANAGTLMLFITATIIAGIGQGIAISAATRGLLHGSTRPTGHPSSARSIYSATLAPLSSALFPVNYSTPSRYRKSLADTADLPSSQPCSPLSVHAIRIPKRPGTTLAMARRRLPLKVAEPRRIRRRRGEERERPCADTHRL